MDKVNNKFHVTKTSSAFVKIIYSQRTTGVNFVVIVVAAIPINVGENTRQCIVVD